MIKIVEIDSAQKEVSYPYVGINRKNGDIVFLTRPGHGFSFNSDKTIERVDYFSSTWNEEDFDILPKMTLFSE